MDKWGVLCDNKCPFDDCERKYKGITKYHEDGTRVSVVDLTPACRRYMEYLANQINTWVKNRSE